MQYTSDTLYQTHSIVFMDYAKESSGVCYWKTFTGSSSLFLSKNISNTKPILFKNIIEYSKYDTFRFDVLHLYQKV